MYILYCLVLTLGLWCVNSENTKYPELEELRSRVTALEKHAEELANMNNILELALSKTEKRSLEKPAFTVQLTTDVSYENNEVVVFDDVIYDASSDYNLFGFFRCPNDGAYLFSVTIHSPPSKRAQVRFRHNNSTQEWSNLFSRTYMYDAADFSGSHTNTIIVAAAEGDEISILSDGSGSTGGTTEIIGGGPYSIFMGYEI